MEEQARVYRDVRARDLKVGDRITSVSRYVSWPVVELTVERGVVRADLVGASPLSFTLNALVEIECAAQVQT